MHFLKDRPSVTLLIPSVEAGLSKCFHSPHFCAATKVAISSAFSWWAGEGICPSSLCPHSPALPCCHLGRVPTLHPITGAGQMPASTVSCWTTLRHLANPAGRVASQGMWDVHDGDSGTESRVAAWFSHSLHVVP